MKTQTKSAQKTEKPFRLLLYNPNTSTTVTRRLEKEARRWLSPASTLTVLTAPVGPAGIETAYHEAEAGWVTARELKAREGTFDAAIIACFADPGLWAAREVAADPVVGILEASMLRAMLLGRRFSIIASGGRGDVSAFHECVVRSGFEARLASIKYLDQGVAGVPEAITGPLREKAVEAVHTDGADVLLLGCAAFAGQGDALSREIGVPVLDGVRTALGLAQMLAQEQRRRRAIDDEGGDRE